MNNLEKSLPNGHSPFRKQVSKGTALFPEAGGKMVSRLRTLRICEKIIFKKT